MPPHFYWKHLCIQHSDRLMFILTVSLFRVLEMFPFTLRSNIFVDLAPVEDLAQSVYLEKITSVPVKILKNNFEKKAIK